MIVRLVLLGILFSLGPVLLSNCCGDRSDEPVRPFYRVKDWTTDLIRIDSVTYNGHLKIEEATIDGRLSLPYYRMGIRLLAEVDFYSYCIPSYGSLMALSCYSPTPSGYEGSQDTITGFEVISNQDFDSQHPAGSVLNDVLTIFLRNYYETLNGISGQSLVTYLNDAPSPGRLYTFVFAKAPDTSKEHVFTIRYKQSYNLEVIKKTPPIRFL